VDFCHPSKFVAWIVDESGKLGALPHPRRWVGVVDETDVRASASVERSIAGQDVLVDSLR